MTTEKECAICGQGLYGKQVKIGACAGKCADQWAADVVDTITRMAVDDTARVMMREGFRLDADEAASLGDHHFAWVRRLGLTVAIDDNGDVIGTPR